MGDQGEEGEKEKNRSENSVLSLVEPRSKPDDPVHSSENRMPTEKRIRHEIRIDPV